MAGYEQQVVFFSLLYCSMAENVCGQQTEIESGKIGLISIMWAIGSSVINDIHLPKMAKPLSRYHLYLRSAFFEFFKRECL